MFPKTDKNDAEYLTRSDFEKTYIVPSRTVAGKNQRVTRFHCPTCSAVSEAEHGVTTHCLCGTSWVCYGNGLYVWSKKTKGNKKYVEKEIKRKLEKEALENAKGFLENPIFRRKFSENEFYTETVNSINAALNM